MKTLFLILFLIFSFNLLADDIYYNNSDTTEVEIIEEKILPIEVHHYYYYPSYDMRLRNFHHFRFHWRPIFVFHPLYYHWWIWNYYWHPFSFYTYHYWQPFNFYFHTWTPIYYSNINFYHNYSSTHTDSNIHYGHRSSMGSTVDRSEVRNIKSYQSEAKERRERITEGRTYMRPNYRNPNLEVSRRRPAAYTRERQNEIMRTPTHSRNDNVTRDRTPQRQSTPPTRVNTPQRTPSRATQPPQQSRPPARVTQPSQRQSSPPRQSSAPSRNQTPNRR